MQGAPLSRAAARIFFNAADAWYAPDHEGQVAGGAELDLLAHLEGCLSPEEGPALERGLRVLEWIPRLLGRRRFSALPRGDRRALLRRLEGSSIGPLRRRASRLRSLVECCYLAARGAREEGNAQASPPEP